VVSRKRKTISSWRGVILKWTGCENVNSLRLGLMIDTRNDGNEHSDFIKAGHFLITSINTECMTFGIFKAIRIQTVVFRVEIPEDESNKFLRNVVFHLQNYIHGVTTQKTTI
jgi:hypothetical protein